jgi:hypothetical protein
MTSDHISATAAYMTWREEHFWIVSILQRVEFSSVVLVKTTVIKVPIMFIPV